MDGIVVSEDSFSQDDVTNFRSSLSTMIYIDPAAGFVSDWDIPQRFAAAYVKMLDVVVVSRYIYCRVQTEAGLVLCLCLY